MTPLESNALRVAFRTASEPLQVNVDVHPTEERSLMDHLQNGS